jgi:SAM-dependent methyltransferase
VTAAPAPRTLGHLFEAVNSVAALTAASRLGVLDRLDRGPVTAAGLVADGQVSAHGAPLLLEALRHLGLVDRLPGDRYVAAAPELACAGRTLLGLPALLTDVVRTGDGTAAVDRPENAQTFYPSVVARLGESLADAAAQAARLLTEGTAPRLVLDAGAGAAPWSIALARQAPDCHVTALDLPGVLPATRAAVAAAGHTGRYTFLGADLRHADLAEAAYDLVLLGNVCHLLDADANRELMGRVAGTLRPHGTVAIVNVLPVDDGPQARAVALYAFGRLARTTTSHLHAYADYRDWLTAAGLTGTRRRYLDGQPPLTLITAARGPW